MCLCKGQEVGKTSFRKSIVQYVYEITCENIDMPSFFGKENAILEDGLLYRDTQIISRIVLNLQSMDHA